MFWDHNISAEVKKEHSQLQGTHHSTQDYIAHVVDISKKLLTHNGICYDVAVSLRLIEELGSEVKWANPVLKMGNSLKSTKLTKNLPHQVDYHEVSAVSEMLIPRSGSNSRLLGYPMHFASQ